MLEGCRNLRESEARITDFVTAHEVRLLAEIPLSEEDVGWLDTQVRECLRQGPRLGSQFLRQKAPLSFATYLVWQGIRGYREGDFWSAVHGATGVPESRYQTDWGRAFLRILSKHTLLTVPDDPGFAYVGPILFHGGVPDSCLPEYFREVCWKSLVSQGLTQEKEVTAALAELRQDAERVSAVRREVQAVETEISECHRLLKLCESYLESSVRLVRLKNQRELLAEVVQIQKEVTRLRATQEELFEQLRDAQQRIGEYSRPWQDLLSTKPLALEYRGELDRLYDQITTVGAHLEACTRGLNELAIKLFDQPWAESVTEPLLGLDRTVLERARGDFQELIEQKSQVKRRYRNVNALGGTGLVVAPLLLILTGKAWPTAILLAVGLTLVAGAKQWFIRAMRAIQNEEQQVRALLPRLPWAADPLGNATTISGDMDTMQRLLRERNTVREGLQRFHERLSDMEHRTRGALTTAGSSPTPQSSGNSGAAAGDGEAPMDVPSVLTLWKVVYQRVERWLADIAEAEMRQQAAVEARVRIVDLTANTDQLTRVVKEKQERLTKAGAALLTLGVTPPPADTDGYSALKDMYESIRAREEETAAAVRRARAGLAAHMGEVTPEAVRDYKQTIDERLRTARERRASIMAGVGVSPAYTQLDRPTERFLTHGGQRARSFVVATVALLTATIRAGEPRLPTEWPLSYRYERIYAAFQTWWRSEGQDLCVERMRRLPGLRLVAWKEGGEWALGIRVPEVLLDQPQLELRQGGSELATASREGCWYLTNLSDEVLASCSDYQEIRLSVGRYVYRDMPIVVCQGWEGDRRLLPAVRRTGRAKRLLVFFPDTWRLGKPDWAVESVGMPPGYQVCYVDLAETGVIPFVDAQGTPVTVDLGGGQRFDLVGNVLPIDRDHEQGPLFVGEPPRFRCLQEELLGEVAWAELVPGGVQAQPSPDWLSGGVTLAPPQPSGCFEVVVYDRQHVEMERLPFRYAAHLQGICLSPDPVPVFPEPEGHPTVTARFDTHPGCTVELKAPCTESQGRATAAGREASLPAAAAWDRTVWELRSEGGGPVPIELVLQRIWWAAGDCGRPPGEWTDRVVTIAPDWVKAASEKALWLRCEPTAALPDMRAGFGDSLRSYRLNRTGVVEMPLREYCDLIAAAPDQEHVFRVWVQGRDGAEATGQIALCRPPVLTERCSVCIKHARDLPAQELTKCCATCDFCQLQCHGEEMFCTSGQWRETRLPKREFERLMATNVCNRWDGEYPGQPFGWEATRLIGARIRTTDTLEEAFGAPVRGRGVVTEFEAGRVCVHWDDPAGAYDTWFCRHHYYYLCTEVSQT